MKKIELEIIAISHSITQSQSYAVVLGEVNGSRRLPIVIGGFEAQAIAVALEKMNPSRPLTHDLMKNFLIAFGIDLHEVIINDLQEGVFYSKLVCSNEQDTIEIDSRTSDASKKKKTGEESLEEEIKKTGNEDLKQMSVEELTHLLNEVLETEDYLRAIAIRDEINSRNQENS